ncbi:glutamate rich 3 [Ictidomys tridecemlineatus]|uniref:Glutamate rich 3 n=2 Tax=Ictidomys tridecemlineatus TaxID=43179 RepID=I3N0X8_ICTTR|nr:glutamate-rich protein 3 isoform X1 [Ictidomys tridecemlineatus]KAG3283385.1 glutamate rich 3 [Ictidomys tridecemlineatus]
MSHSHPAGLLATYNSLTDKHLAGYFNNTRIRRHLLRSGLITRSGRILSEKEYKLNIMKRDHQKYIRECLAQAIFHKVLDLERHHQLEIKKKLETLARKEQIQRFKGENTRQFIENNMPILSPRPPLGPKTNRGQSVLVSEGHSSPLTLTAPRPYTAPGNMQPPIRLQPLPRNPAVGTVPKITSGSRLKPSVLENEAPFPIGGKKAMMKFRNSMNNSQRMNPYQFPRINSYLMPVPPLPPPRDGKVTRDNRSQTWRRRFRPITAPNGLEPLFPRVSGRIHKTSLHSNAAITMIYLGKNVHLAYDNQDFRDEIKIYQQHCGGENLCVYKGKLFENETFQFISKRHHGFPFSLTFFLNGLQVNRLSSCCEFKHRKGSRLGGRRGYFGFVCVEKASPCYKCIIAMGLDKKPSSMKPRKEKSTDKREELRKDRENGISRRNEMEVNKTSLSATCSVQEINMGVREVRTAMEEMELKGKQIRNDWENNQRNTFKYEYEEDFEIDEEKQDEKANEEGQADDQMNGISKSPSEDEKDNLGPEESEILSLKAPDADDNVKDEDDGCSESESEENKQASTISSGSHPYSSDSEDDLAERGSEVHVENSTQESPRSSSAQELSENGESEKSHHLIEESLEIETEDQDITKAAVETQSLPREESCENVLEEMQKGTQQIAENLFEKSRKPTSKEEKEKSKLWEVGTAKVKDKSAGLPEVEKEVGQIISEALAPGCHCHYDAESDVSSTDEGGKPTWKLEIDTGGAPNRNFIVEERAPFHSEKESEQITLQKKEAGEEVIAPQHQDAELRDGVGIKEAPLGEWQTTAGPLALAEQPTENSKVPLCMASWAEEEAEGDGRQDLEGFKATGIGAGRDSVGLSEGEAPQEQALRQTVLGTEQAGSEGEQGIVEGVLTNTTALSTEHLQEAAALREPPTTPKMEVSDRGVAVSEAGTPKTDVDVSEEEALTEQEDMGPIKDTASEREDGSQEAIVGGKEPGKERKEVLETESPLSISTGEAGARQMGLSEGSPEELCEEGAARAETGSEAEDDKKERKEPKEPLPEESEVAGEGRKAESPGTPLREIGSEREEVTRAIAAKDEDTLEEERKHKGEEGEAVKEERSEEQTKEPENETESDAEDAEPTETTEMTQDSGLLEDSLKERQVTLCEVTHGFEKSLEKMTALRKEERGESLNEARDTEHRDRAGLLGLQNVALPEQGQGPHHDGEGTLEAAKCATQDQDGLAGMQTRDEEEPFQGPGGAGVMMMTGKDVPEGDFMIVEKFSEEAVGGDPPEEEEEEHTLGIRVTRVIKDSNTEGDGATRGGAVLAEEGGAAERREVLADSKMAKGKTVANRGSSFSDVAWEETWHRGDEVLGKTAAAERVAAEETGLSREEVTVTSAEPGEGALQETFHLKGQGQRLGQDQEEGEVEATQGVRSVGEGEGAGSSDARQESGTAEEFRQRSSPEREVELSRGSLEAVATLFVKPEFSGTQEEQEHMVQRESESADVPLNSVKD